MNYELCAKAHFEFFSFELKQLGCAFFLEQEKNAHPCFVYHLIFLHINVTALGCTIEGGAEEDGEAETTAVGGQTLHVCAAFLGDTS